MGNPTHKDCFSIIQINALFPGFTGVNVYFSPDPAIPGFPLLADGKIEIMVNC
jgi:hypothetical protein